MKVLIAFIVLVGSIPYGFSICLRDGLECPDYRSVENHTDYELREYPVMKWAVTEEKGTIYFVAQAKSYLKLFSYFYHNNDQGIRIPSTYPVRGMWMYKKGDRYKHTLVASLMIPSQLIKRTPIPSDSSVHVLTEPPAKYFVRTFSGYMVFDWQWEREARMLRDSLQGRKDADTSLYYRCSFDPRWRLFRRRNEIWMRQI